MSAGAEWFETWFGEEYVALYPHRNEAEAEQAIDLIASAVADRTITRVLDLACGPGRHSKYLGRRWWTSGVDLSEALLKLARRNGTSARLVRADIRQLPYRQSCFDLVVNLFTSFGYFETDAEHEHVLSDLARVMLPRGTFVLDFLNEHRVKANLVARDEQILGGKHVEQRREITSDGKYVVKHIDIKTSGRHFIERVRLFSKSELTAMLERAGFTVERGFGNYDGAELAEDSPRVILIARRN